jgi:hypothetical protein
MISVHLEPYKVFLNLVQHSNKLSSHTLRVVNTVAEKLAFARLTGRGRVIVWLQTTD